MQYAFSTRIHFHFGFDCARARMRRRWPRGQDQTKGITLLDWEGKHLPIPVEFGILLAEESRKITSHSDGESNGGGGSSLKPSLIILQKFSQQQGA